jgi:lipopolysaccharide export system permease protein
MRSFLRALALAVASGLILFVLVDLFEHIERFLDHRATATVVARYYLYKMPWIIDTVLPIALLMSTLFTVGAMARYNELTALFAAGRSLVQVTLPLILFAAATSLASLAWSEYVLPVANSAHTRVWEVEVQKRPDRARPTTNLALTGEDGRLYFARSYNPAICSLSDLTVQTLQGAQVVERIDATSAEWDGGQWVLKSGTRRFFAGEQERAETFVALEAPFLALLPDDLLRERVKAEDMNVRQLSRRMALLARSGHDAREYAVERQFRLAYPAVHLIVVLLGILLASGPRKTSIASGFGWTVLISFGYYLTMNFGRALGHSGALPPVAAGWGGNAIYATIAVLLMWRARR